VKRVSPGDDDGFTLVEVLMAMLVMSVAVAAIIDGLTTIIGHGREHRGHAVMEAATRNGASSTVAVANGTRLRSELVTTSTTLEVLDASLLPPPTTEGSYVTVGTEVMKVLTRNTTDDLVTVTRRVNGETSTVAALGSVVAPVLRCPTATQLTPTLSSSALPDGSAVQVATVDYWAPGGTGGSFVDRPACLAAYEVRCPAPEILVECGYGLVRATVRATTTDSRLNGKTEETVLLVRQGGR
jgi:prepilin-type N-terminal cleavage/methylation domain-containing protein